MTTAAFPDLGWYALVDPEDGPEQEIGLSIAVGDLAEIPSDLLGVLWLFENASHNDAVWDFRFGYQTHWGSSPSRNPNLPPRARCLVVFAAGGKRTLASAMPATCSVTKSSR